ncbi:uncharacterized protein LOC106652933 isoform X2 [Trichogramma pretiosum]|uniref:uncharacterized protein LOC106652933 isoform X2 n=1 Tax=Trichogramma pretiosum TaxID=7493 RepID=UPI0006C9658F|nr:uncharacterized protein LOC106652933 isoform X2 [Trichogramma pretiosum]
MSDKPTIDGYNGDCEAKTFCYYAANPERVGDYFYVKYTRIMNSYSQMTMFVSFDDGTKTYELDDGPFAPILQTQDAWSARGLSFEVTEADKRVRIRFNGLLKRGNRAAYNAETVRVDELEHVRFVIQFTACSEPFVGSEDAWDPRMSKGRIDQWGLMWGRITPESLPDRTFELRGMRQLVLGPEIIDPKQGKLTLRVAEESHSSFCRYVVPEKLPASILGYIHRNERDAKDFYGFVIPLKSERLRRGIKISQIDVLEVKLLTTTKRSTFGSYPKYYRTTYWDCEIHLNDSKCSLGLLESTTLNDLIELSKLPPPIVPPPVAKKPVPAAENEEETKKSLALVLDLANPFTRDASLCGLKVAALGDLRDKVALWTSAPAQKTIGPHTAPSFATLEFEVPSGFCVTTLAFEAFLEHNRALAAAIDDLIKCYKTRAPPRVGQEPIDWQRKNVAPDIAACLAKIDERFKKSRLPPDVERMIGEKLDEASRDPMFNRLWAVRSSPYFADPEETLAQGKYDSYIGFPKVVSGVIKIWASAFKRESVEHRHRSGLPLKSPVAVLVQRMVESHAAGLVHTRHPLTGDPREIHVLASYGVGVGVSEGHVEGDRFVVRRSNDDRGELKIISAWIGDKDMRVDHCGKQHCVEQEQREKLSITEPVALRLAAIGREIDKVYDSARDLEWAWTGLPGDKFYVLQCRPAARDSAWTDYELTHELGSGFTGQADTLTFAQADELFPRVVTPLTCTTILDNLDPSTFALDDDDDEDDDEDDDDEKPDRQSPIFIANMRVAFNYHHLAMRNCEKTRHEDMVLRDFGLFGRPIYDREIHEAWRKRNDVGDDHRLGFVDRVHDRFSRFDRSIRRMKFKKLVLGKKEYAKRKVDKRCKRKVLEMKSVVDEHNSGQSGLKGAKMTVELEKHLVVLRLASRRYGYISRACVSRQLEIMSLLRGDAAEFTAQNFADMSHLLTNKYSISQKVPRLVLEMNAEIRNGYLFMDHQRKISRPKLEDADVSEIDQWLRKYGGDYAFSEMGHFTDHYENLGPNEFELESEPHVTKPERIYKLLQYLHPWLKNPKGELMEIRKSIIESIPPTQLYVEYKNRHEVIGAFDQSDVQELVKKIASPISRKTRKRIARLLPAARHSLVMREWARCLLSKAVNKVRGLYAQKAIELVNEGKLPDEKLIYYLTRWEVAQLVDAPCSPGLIKKALRRRELWPRLDEARYRPVNRGVPRVIGTNDDDDQLGDEVYAADYATRGVPVCAGVVCNRVFVAERFDDELQGRLQPWDILVVPYIDAGWSQYFPMIGGIITERGSLFSHGAATARDYGVPCIMGVPNATRIFKTGDGVHMDGSTGEIKREDNKSAYFVDNDSSVPRASYYL